MVSLAGQLDYETKTSHAITVKATSTDGSMSSADFTIEVLNQNDNITAILDVDSSSNRISENAVIGTEIGFTAFAEDYDETDAVTYSLANDHDGLFSIDELSGVLTLSGQLDYELTANYELTVLANSSDGGQTSLGLDIFVDNILTHLMI